MKNIFWFEEFFFFYHKAIFCIPFLNSLPFP
jgi:hypothetical protein